jgi:2-C-methyl-D-erythritol 4-phosphate cytidylyltransferase
MKITAIVPAAGSSTRFQNETPKLLMNLNGKPVIVHTLNVLLTFCHQIIIPVPREKMLDYDQVFEKFLGPKKRFIEIIAGSTTRAGSISEALVHISPESTAVCVHDGARPLITHEIISKCLTSIEKHEAVIVARPATDTLKITTSTDSAGSRHASSVTGTEIKVIETPDRKKYYLAQTPQIFKTEILLKAYAQSNIESATDDASLVERLGIEVFIVEGPAQNIKITTYEDFLLAEAILKTRCTESA